MAGKPGGYSGGKDGPMGGHVDAVGGGYGIGGKGGGNDTGPQGKLSSRYTGYNTPSYEASWGNLAKLGIGSMMGLAAPGIGIGLGPMASDAMGMGYTGYQGTTKGYSYDSKNMAMSGQGQGAMSAGRQVPPPPYGQFGTAQQHQSYLDSISKPATAKAPAPATYIPQKTIDTKWLGVNAPGLPSYGVYSPFYRWGSKTGIKATENPVK